MQAHNWITENNQLRKALFAEQERNRKLLKENAHLRELLEDVAGDTAEHTSVVLRKVRQTLKGGEK